MTRSTKLLTAGGFLAFFVFGFVDNLKGQLLPPLLSAGDFSYSQGGLIMLAVYLGFILATLTAGVLADVLHNRGVLFLAGICLSVGCLAIGATGVFALLIFSMGVMGFGLGAIELGGNGLMVELHDQQRGKYLNLLATFHGLGSLIVPLYAAGLLMLGVHWQAIYALSAVIVAPLTIIFWPGSRRQSRLGEMPQFANTVDVKSSDAKPVWDGSTIRKLAFTRQMIAYYVLIAAYVATELGVAAWMVEYLQHEHGISVPVSALILSCFFGLLMTGRLLGAFVVERLGYSRAIAISLISSSLCLAVGIFGQGSMVYFLPCSGFFMSIVFPTVVAAASDLHKANVGTILGILFAFAGVGGAVGPWTIGLMSDFAGLQIGLSCCILFSAIALVALAFVKCLS